MFSHIMIGTNNIEHAKQFYDAVLGVLGAGEPMRNQAPSGHTRLFYLHDGGMFRMAGNDCIPPFAGMPAACSPLVLHHAAPKNSSQRPIHGRWLLLRA